MSTSGIEAAGATRTVHFVLPGDVADPAVPSGGNVYDRRVCQGLAEAGWRVHRHAVPGEWPRPRQGARAELARTLAALPHGAVTLLDGLVACGVPEIVVPQAGRLRLAVLVHLPLAAETGLAPQEARDLERRERAMLQAAAVTVATSPWAGRELAERHRLAPGRVRVVPPGTDPAPLAPGTDGASRLVCVAAVTPRKGHDLLVRALGLIGGLRWSCICAGPLQRAPRHVARVRELIGRLGLGERISLAGPLTGERLEACYAAADLVVLPSRAETYGMVVTEALARGIPVLTTTADALPDTLGRAPDGRVPGLLVPPHDVRALADALRRWLGDPALRERLREAARARRRTLPGWDLTVRHLGKVLQELQRQPLKAAWDTKGQM